MHAPIVPYSIAPGDDRPSFPGTGQWKPLIRTLRHPMIGGLATAALLAVMFIGAYLAFFTPNDPNSGNPTVPAAAIGPSPEASPASEPYECATTDPYFGCPQLLRQVGINIAWYPNLEESALEARQVQLQGWAIAPGASLAGADEGDAATGVVVDVVLSGAYVATFDVPVVVARGAVTNDLNQVEYLEAGATVELGRGDSVSYQLGGLAEIHNPLNSQRIEFKRAVIYEGDISAFSATADGITTRVEADAVLAEPIGSNSSNSNETRVEFWYLHIRRGAAFPPPLWEGATVIGPVDPQRGPEGTDGFVLVIGNTILG